MKLKILLVRAYQHLVTATARDQLELDSSAPNAVMLLTSDYGNIGDLAIGYAQERYLESLERPFRVHSVPIASTYRVLRKLRKQLKKDDIVFLVGGGNMGDLYPQVQLGREFIAQYLRGHRIISFPQSIIYMDRPERAGSAEREARALSKHADRLTLFARERQSLVAMQEFFPGDVGFAPDIVLALTPEFQSQPAAKRKDVVLALRQDAERALTSGAHQIIRRVASTLGKVIDRDNGIPDAHVTDDTARHLPLETLELYRRSALVVTDRLHGMIFAAVTGTPCVVFPNSNHKITETYSNWISGQCAYIKLLDDADEQELEAAAREVMSAQAKDGYQDVRFDFSELKASVLEHSR